MNTVYCSICAIFNLFYQCLTVFRLQVSFASLVRFILRYFIVFDASINGIVFIISLSDSSLFVYRTATDFCVLTLYPASLLNSFISFNCYIYNVYIFNVYIYNMSSANSDSFNVFFSIWMSFIPFSSMIVAARTSNSCINVVRVAILVLLLILEEMLSSFYC